MRPVHKQEFVYALFSAVIYTLFYVILANLAPGVGFENSLVARFAIKDLLLLAFYFLIFSLMFTAVVGSCLGGIFRFVFRKFDIPDAESISVFGLLISVPAILYIAVAFGFVSIGGV